jgi:carnitine 3-dehydrogenase
MAVPDVGLLGGGVIGSGWAARFLLNGIDVRLFDPDPDAAGKVEEVLANARRAYARLTLAPLPAEGSLTVVSTPEQAVEGAGFVQESAPEREGLKRDLLAAASRAAAPDVPFASSTSGLLPSRLAADMRNPERLVVGHPFNPVYLLPLVEVCGGAPEARERAAALYRQIGMRPLMLRREIDGFVADRLLEALWREALWLVHDDVATVAEIDDAIRFGAGLRWAFMGTFLTYRIGGGEQGMRHFLEQFGPTLALPWTKLMDVPELGDGLLDKLVAQSEDQAAGRSIRELEQARDDCLVAIIQGLRAQGAGAGAVLADYERRLLGRTPGDEVGVHAARVLPEWVDYNGHMHESRYLQLFGDATDALLRHLAVDVSRGSYFTVETHLSHLQEATADERVRVTTLLLDHDQKRMHLFHELRRDDALLATAEQMLLHVDASTRRAAPAPPDLLERVAALAAAHADLPRPDRAGRVGR